MNFTQYRSKVLKEVHRDCDIREYTRVNGFSTHRVDDLVADAWKAEVSLVNATTAVKAYLRTLTG